MCADINYAEQSHYVRRLHQLFGNNGKDYLDIACGTGPHVQHFVQFGYTASGVDINQPMLDIAQIRCPTAHFIQQDMSNLGMVDEMDLISCFLYSIHYNQSIDTLKACIASVHTALRTGGIFCFNTVNKRAIDNRIGVKHSLLHEGSEFSFQSSWHYDGHGDQQLLLVSIEKTTDGIHEVWQDQHTMVALTFEHLQKLLAPYFEVHMFEHHYDKITPWNTTSGNAFVVCVKR